MNGDQQIANTRKTSLVVAVVIIAALYLGKEFFVPLVLAVLISFLLAPLIRRFEKWGMGRIVSVIVASALAFSFIGGLGYIVAGQLMDLADELPKYKDNLMAKAAALKTNKNSTFGRLSETLQDVSTEIKESQEPTDADLEKAAVEPKPGEQSKRIKQQPIPVEVVEPPDHSLELLRNFASSLFAPLGVAAVVIIFVIFMLLEREDLRDRFIHLIGRGRLHVTTQALDDAGRRVSRYLLAQLIVNSSYGIPVGIGLYFIGIPNAVLWGLLATIFRFIPYVGPWIAAAFPVALSLAVSPSWTTPLITVGMFVVMELISNNVVEPWLYGSSTGLSPMAIIVSAVFWTWLWGPIGLLMATPLTVCLAVIGKHIPSLGFLDVLLGDKPPILPTDRLYQRLLAFDEEEAVEIVETYITEHSLGAAYDEVVLPAVRQAEQDSRTGTLEDHRRREVYALIRRLLGDLDETPPPPANVPVQVLCLPASSEADELIAIMLAHLLEKRLVLVRVLSSKSLASEMVEEASESGASVICVSTLPPASVMPATYLCKRLKARLPEARVMVGLWHEQDVEVDRRIQRLKRAQADDVSTSLDKMAAEIAVLANLGGEPIISAAPAAAVA